jgi:hypothetical protein
MEKSNQLLLEPAAPVAPPPPQSCDGPWRDGMLLVVSPTTILPDRCITCDADARRLRGSRRISTLSAWYPLFASARWDAQSVEDRPIHIRYGLCPTHRAARLARVALVAILGSASIFSLAVIKTRAHLGPFADVLALLIPLLFLASTLLLRPTIRPRRVYHGLAWFAGASPDFLQSLPDLTDSCH